jgi:general secretion pathway protein K
VNLNLATREAMQLLPGLDDELIENILAFREIEDLQNRAEIAEIVPFENLQELSAWVGNGTSNFFSVVAYRALEIEETALAELVDEQEFVNLDPVTQAFTEIIEVRGYNTLPRVYKIEPYGALPDTSPPRVRPEDLLF